MTTSPCEGGSKWILGNGIHSPTPFSPSPAPYLPPAANAAPHQLLQDWEGTDYVLVNCSPTRVLFLELPVPFLQAGDQRG